MYFFHEDNTSKKFVSARWKQFGKHLSKFLRKVWAKIWIGSFSQKNVLPNCSSCQMKDSLRILTKKFRSKLGQNYVVINFLRKALFRVFVSSGQKLFAEHQLKNCEQCRSKNIAASSCYIEKTCWFSHEKIHPKCWSQLVKIDLENINQNVLSKVWAEKVALFSSKSFV